MSRVSEWAQVKQHMIHKHGYHCEVCDYTLAIECDHIVPKAQGGNNTEDNAILLCPNCHHLKNKVWPQFRSHNSPMPHTRGELIKGIHQYIEMQHNPQEARIVNPAEDLINYS